MAGEARPDVTDAVDKYTNEQGPKREFVRFTVPADRYEIRVA